MDVARLRTAIARADRLLARQGDGEGLTRTQFSVLGAVARRSPQRLSDLCAREGLNPTMLSRVVGDLEKQGLVVRRAASEDARQVLVEIAPAGCTLYEQRQKERTALLEDWVGTLSSQDQQRLSRALPLLEGLVDHLQART